MKPVLFALFVASAALCTSCVSRPPTFVEVPEASWKVIDIRQGLSYEDAWQNLVDRARKKYDVEVMDKDSGYLRTGWLYTTSGKLRQDYKTRISFKFSPQKDKLEVKAEAFFNKVRRGVLSGVTLKDYGWIPGEDTALLNDVYKDVSALLGRIGK